jgi:phosphatidate cytidylyltransferase
MSLRDALENAYFWAYAGSAAVLLAAAWGLLFKWQRKGLPLEDYRRVYWSWVLHFGVAILAVFLGLGVFVLVVSLVCLFACKEFARATGLYRDWIFTGLVYVAILAVNGIALWAGLSSPPAGAAVNRGYDAFLATPIYAVAVLCVLPVLRNRSEGMLQLVALAVMAFVYFGYFLAHLSLLAGGRPPEVYGYLFFLLFGTATTELAGWLAGRRWGRHPVAPRISTEITWESASVALVWALLWSFSLGWTLPQREFGPVAMLLSTVLFGMLGPLGDLVMRYIWRDLGLKAQEEGTPVVPYLALNHLNRLIFVAPLFFRLVHFVDPELWSSSP